MYKKQVAIIRIEDKPMFLVDIQTLDNQESYLALKKECEKNYNDYVNKIKQEKSDFENAVNVKVNTLAVAVKSQLK
jgi:hypothetical protein